ncbi:MAG: ABC transporter permease [Dehalococcoidia bacterium]
MSEQAQPTRAGLARPPLRLEWMRWGRLALPYIIPPIVAAALAGVAWELYIEVSNESKFVLPRPTAVADALFSDIGFFAEQGLRTFWVSAGGLALGTAAALALATVMAHSRVLERALLPIAIMVKVTPIVALAPLFIIWFGFGWQPKVAIAALITYFPVLINGIVGFRDVDPRALDFLRSVHASPVEVYVRLRVPSALPYLFAALKIAATLSLIGAVVAEFFAAGQGGLGSVIAIENVNLRLDRLFAAVLVLAAIGVLMNTTISIIERVVLSWHRTTITAPS